MVDVESVIGEIKSYFSLIITKMMNYREKYILVGILGGVFLLFTGFKLIHSSPIKKLKKCRTPSSLSYFLVSKCMNSNCVKNVLSGKTKEPNMFLSEVKADCRRASMFGGILGSRINSDTLDRLVVVYEYIREYAELKKTVLNMRKSQDYNKYTDLLKASLLPKGETDWTTLGFQREDSPVTDYRGAGCLAPVMLYSLSKLDKKFIQNVLNESKKEPEKMYMFASVNIGIIYNQSKLLEDDSPFITSYLFGEKDKGIDTDINPFDKVKEMEGKNLINRRYALYYQYLSKQFDKYFHESNGSLMQSQTLLDSFFEDVKKGKY